jgi:hypothetical protein
MNSSDSTSKQDFLGFGTRTGWSAIRQAMRTHCDSQRAFALNDLQERMGGRRRNRGAAFPGDPAFCARRTVLRGPDRLFSGSRRCVV